MFELTTRFIDEVVIVEPHGVLHSAEQGTALQDKIRDCLEHGHRQFVVDLKDVPRFENINYGAFASVIHAYSTVRNASGMLKLAGMTKRVKDLFTITRLLTVFETFPDHESAVASFRKAGPPPRKYTLAIVPTADGRMKIEVLERLETAEVRETGFGKPALSTIWLPATSIFSDREIGEFEALVNAEPPAQESVFQAFFEAHAKWLYLLGEQYEEALPHAKLPPLELDPALALTAVPADEVTMVPDFLLKRIGLDLWDVLDIKLPSTKTIVGRPSRRRFSQEVADAVAQLREYDRRLRTPKVRERLLKEHSITVAEPLPMVLVGRDFAFEGSHVEKDRFRQSEGVRVYTYDDLHRLAKQRRVASAL